MARRPACPFVALHSDQECDYWHAHLTGIGIECECGLVVAPQFMCHRPLMSQAEESNA